MEQAGLRPVLILSHAQSRTTRWLSWVRVSQIRTLSVERIGRRLARASEEEVDRVVEGLNEIVG